MKYISYATFKFIRGRGIEGRAFLENQFTMLKTQVGLLRAFISEGAGDPDSYFIYSEWKDEESHNKMVQNIRTLLSGGTEYMRIMPILYTMPVMESYKIVKE